MWLKKMFEEAPCGLSSPRWGCSTSCSLGPDLGAAFFCFFSRLKEPFEGCQTQENHILPFPEGAHLHFEELRESQEELRVRSIVLKNCKRIDKEYFCWNCTVLTRCMNRAGFEFWVLSRNRKCHVSAMKCRQILYLSPGTPWISNLSFANLLALVLVREHFYMYSYLSNTNMHATYSSTLPFSLPSFFCPSCSPFSFCYYGVPFLPLCL